MIVVDIAATLRSARGAAGVTLRTLADRAGTSHSTLAAYEAGAKIPRVDTMQRILEAAGSKLVAVRGSELELASRLARGRQFEELLRFTAHFPTSRRGPLADRRFTSVA